MRPPRHLGRNLGGANSGRLVAPAANFHRAAPNTVGKMAAVLSPTHKIVSVQTHT
jgi:hypothetical protein